MIPYWEIPALEIWGPIKIQPFGAVVALGIYLTTLYVGKLARNYGESEKLAQDLLTWVIVCVVVGNHVFEILFYTPERLSKEGLIVLLKVWDGMSSTGGILSGLIGWFVFVKWKKMDWRRSADMMSQMAAFFLCFGRLGCAIVHDHPGARSEWFLAVDFPGGPRHDLGLYEFLYLSLFLFPLMTYAQKRNVKPGSQLFIFLVFYGAVRFLLDFLRKSDLSTQDTRYLGLTPAQYLTPLFIMIGIFVFFKLNPQLFPFRKKHSSES